MSSMVFYQSVWVDRHVLGMEVTEPGLQKMQFINGGSIIINNSCSGLKQILQFVILFLVFPGPRIRKLWFIPMGIVVVHLTNIFRIVGLSVITVEAPQHWHFSHDYIFRPIFYLVIFLLWVWWIEKLAPMRNKQ